MPTHSTRPTPSAPPTLARRARSASAPQSPRGRTRPGSVRRRDGIALAATGAIPDRVRAQILDEHRAHLASCQREGIRRRLDLGLLPLAIPYGYRRAVTDLSDTAAGARASWQDPYPDRPWARISRDGRAPAARWVFDPDTAHTVRVAAFWARDGMGASGIAARLAADPIYPRPLAAGGRTRAWTARAVLAVLCEPALTGHGVWGRTRHGGPVPAVEWVVSRTATHPAILPVGLWQATRRAVTADPDRPEPNRTEPDRPDRDGAGGGAGHPWWAR